MRPTLDLERAELPLALAPVELRADETWVARFLEALGVEGRAARELVEQGLAPPYALTGHSIFLAASHFDVRGGVWAREQGAGWLERFKGLRANASRKSHEELDNSSELDRGDPRELAQQIADLQRAYDLQLVGGCCGTDAEHIAVLARALN